MNETDKHIQDLEEVRSNFPILHSHTYLNSCSLGALSTRAEAYLFEFLDLWNTMGASAWYEDWFGLFTLLRERVARFLGTTPGELAMMPTTSAALSSIGESVDYGKRNKVVCTELDFPTVAYQWAAKPEVELVILESPDGIRIEPEQFAEAVDERTMFVATNHVFSFTGFAQDLRAISEIAHAAGAYCLIDGYQAIGQIPVNVKEAGVDFYTAGPLKWMLGGPGLAYLYVREEIVSELSPRIVSWLATKSPFDFDIRKLELRDDAARFELGTPALPTVHTALGGQEMIEEVGIEAIRARNRELSDHLIDGVRARGMDLTMAENPDERTAIIMVQHPDPSGAVAHLAARGVIVDQRPGHVRVSPHYYNTVEEIDVFLEALDAYAPATP